MLVRRHFFKEKWDAFTSNHPIALIKHSEGEGESVLIRHMYRNIYPSRGERWKHGLRTNEDRFEISSAVPNAFVTFFSFLLHNSLFFLYSVRVLKSQQVSINLSYEKIQKKEYLMVLCTIAFFYIWRLELESVNDNI